MSCFPRSPRLKKRGSTFLSGRTKPSDKHIHPVQSNESEEACPKSSSKDMELTAFTRISVITAEARPNTTLSKSGMTDDSHAPQGHVRENASTDTNVFEDEDKTSPAESEHQVPCTISFPSIRVGGLDRFGGEGKGKMPWDDILSSLGWAQASCMPIDETRNDDSCSSLGDESVLRARQMERLEI